MGVVLLVVVMVVIFSRKIVKQQRPQKMGLHTESNGTRYLRGPFYFSEISFRLVRGVG